MIDNLIESMLEQNARRNWDLAEHLRLAAFHEIIDDQQLHIQRIIEYSQELGPKYPPFTHLTSSAVILQHKDLALAERLSGLHLPFNKRYHLMFFLVKTEEPLRRILYDSCPHCQALESDQFPHVELRASVNLQSKGEVIMYDNRMSTRQQDESLLREQYKAMQEFIEKTKV